MSFLFQLDLDHLPAELSGAFGAGLLQLFYCIGDCEGSSGWEAFSPTHHVRVVEVGDPGEPTTTAELRAPKQITGWQSKADLPHPEDHRELGLTYDYDFDANTVKIECAPLDLSFDGLDIDGEHAEKIGVCLDGDKLAGWPYWVQGPELPACTQCGEQMRYVFQIDSNQGIDVMFGDAGIGHISQCPQHHDVVAFAWACC